MTRPFKLFGLQRTGTNLLRHLMLENFTVRSVELGTEWKHGWVEDPRRECGGQPVIFIVCVKNPFAWLWSCFEYFGRAAGVDLTVPDTFEKGLSFHEFLHTSAYGFPDPIYRWNIMNRHWLTYLPHCYVVRQEDMLYAERQAVILRNIAAHFQLEAKRPLAGTARRIKADMSVGGMFDRDYYLTRDYLANFRKEDMHWLRRECFWDVELLKRLDYGKCIENTKCG